VNISTNFWGKEVSKSGPGHQRIDYQLENPEQGVSGDEKLNRSKPRRREEKDGVELTEPQSRRSEKRFIVITQTERGGQGRWGKRRTEQGLERLNLGKGV